MNDEFERWLQQKIKFSLWSIFISAAVLVLYITLKRYLGQGKQ